MYKREIRIIGIDDSPFKKFTKGNILVIGTIFRGGTLLDGILTTKVAIDGNSNTVYTWTQGTGDLATGRTELYSSNNPATYTTWISITGSNNTIRARTTNTSKTKITISGTGNHKISNYGSANDWLINSRSFGFACSLRSFCDSPSHTLETHIKGPSSNS